MPQIVRLLPTGSRRPPGLKQSPGKTATAGSETTDQHIDGSAKEGQKEDRHNDRRAFTETAPGIIAFNQEEAGKRTHGIVYIERAIPCRLLLIGKISGFRAQLSAVRYSRSSKVTVVRSK
jgi:hypothetical protein